MTSRHKDIIIGDEPLGIDEITGIARGRARVTITTTHAFTDRLERSRQMLQRALETGVPVYGVTTGYGKSCGKRMAHDVALLNGNNLIRFHGCGTGEPLGVAETRAAMATRLCCFARGYSGVSLGLMRQIADFLNHGITPVVPAEGSVGASGDLTPMSYVAAALMGEREVFYQDRRMPAREAIAAAGLAPYVFGPKEPLAIMNGTATMTGIAVIAIDRARHLLDAMTSGTALAIHALMGNAHHYDPIIGKAKPHPGQVRVAERIAHLLETTVDPETLEADALETLQDPYSIRCSPQILGILEDSLEWITRWITIEANSANDNPIVDPDSGTVLMGGNFYGGHVGHAMDALKSAVASAADMMDRQVALMVDPHTNRGLPADLVRVAEAERLYNHGFKAMSIAVSSLAAEALKNTMPASSFSRSTESHNQDKVSMGTIAARDCLRVLELTEQVAASMLIAVRQGIMLRENIATLHLTEAVTEFFEALEQQMPFIVEDRALDGMLRTTVSHIQSRRWALYA